MLDDDFSAIVAAIRLGRRIVVPSNGNLAFAMGMVEQFAAGDDLISLRSRAAGYPGRMIAISGYGHWALRPVVAEIFQISRFNMLFEIHASVREALASISAPAAAAFDKG